MELHERFIHGDLEAFETLFRQFQKEVFRWILRIVRDPGVAEDLTVETFWRIYRARARFDARRSFGAWARRIATNVSYDHLKTLRNEIELTGEPEAAAQDPTNASDTRKKVREAFAALPPKLRLTATLALIEETPYNEIADSLGIPVGTVKSRVFKAVRILRTKLKDL